MMNPVFLDTGYVLALELRNDINHQAASSHWKQVATDLPKLVTTSYVFDEILTYFNSRDLHDKAVEVGNRLLQSPSVEIVHIDQELFFKGWEIFQKHQDKRYSFTDCVSFAVMQQLQITAAFAFDKHFAQAGFLKVT